MDLRPILGNTSRPRVTSMSLRSLQDEPVLVLGASGFVGRWVARECVRRGAAVRAVVREPARVPEAFRRGLELVRADLGEPGSAARLVAELRPALVLNAAGYGVAKDERDEACLRRINVGLVQELTEALARLPGHAPGAPPQPRVRLVHLGSALEAGPAPATLEEPAPLRANEPYGVTKSAATAWLDASRERVPNLVARAFTVFGGGERPGRLVPTLLAARATSARIPLSTGTQQRDWLYVEELARALVELALVDGAAVRARRYPFDAPCLNVASGVLTSVRDFVTTFAARFGLAPERLGFGDLPPLATEMHHPPVPIERLRAALGWTPSAGPARGLAELAARVAEGLA